jgi:hypothetical protein
MSAVKLDLEIDQGVSYNFDFQMTDTNNVPINLTGCVFTGELRTTPEAPTETVQLTCSITDAVNGRARFGLTADQTEALPVADSGSPFRKVTSFAYDVKRARLRGCGKRLP